MLDGILDYEKSTTVSGKLRWPGTIHREHGSVGGVRGWWLERRLLCGGDKVWLTYLLLLLDHGGKISQVVHDFSRCLVQVTLESARGG